MASKLRLSKNPLNQQVPALIAADVAYRLYAAQVDAVARLAKLFSSPKDGQIIDYKAQCAVDFGAPQLLFPFNADAQQEAWRTGGMSVVKGVQAYLKAVLTNDGLPELVDSSDYKIGENIGVTPKVVIYHGRLFDIVRYAATTTMVRKVRTLFVPPPINQGVIMDFVDGKSLVRDALDLGISVDMMYWHSADLTMTDVTFADYILAVIEAIDAIGDEEINAMALCLGGTILAMALSLMEAQGRDVVKSVAYINTLTDFSGDTGVMGAMIDQNVVDAAWKKASKNGVMAGADMNAGFRWMSVWDLILSMAIDQFLMGKAPSKSPYLAWNKDGTNLPPVMHRDYLMACYLNNLFAQNKFEVAGHVLKIKNKVPTAGIVGWLDHIVPPKTSIAGMLLMGQLEQLYITENGHIGAIRLDFEKGKYRYSQGPFDDVESIISRSTACTGSWVTPYGAWVEQYSGPLVPASVLPSINLGVSPGPYAYGLIQ